MFNVRSSDENEMSGGADRAAASQQPWETRQIERSSHEYRAGCNRSFYGCVHGRYGRLSRCVDKKIPPNAFGRFRGLAADRRHFLHARCPHE